MVNGLALRETINMVNYRGSEGSEFPVAVRSARMCRRSDHPRGAPKRPWEGDTGPEPSIVREVAQAHGRDVAMSAGTDGGARSEITGIGPEARPRETIFRTRGYIPKTTLNALMEVLIHTSI